MLDIVNSIISLAGDTFGWLVNTRSTFFYNHENDFSLVDKNKNLPPEQCVTGADEYIDKVKKKIGIGSNIIDFVFSSGFAKILTLVGCIAMFFTPLGPAVGAIGVAVTLATMGYGIYQEAKNLQNLSNIKQERAILEEIKNTKEQLDNVLAKNPAAKDLLGGLLIKPFHTFKPSELDKEAIAAQITIANAPPKLLEIGVSIATLNPVAIGASVLSAVLGSSAEVTRALAYETKLNELVNHNRQIKEDIGLSNLPPAKSIEANGEILAIMRAQLKAVEKFTNDHPNLENLTPAQKQEYQEKFVKEYFNNEPLIKPDLKPISLKEAAIDVVKNSFSWQKTNNQFTPMRNNYYHQCSEEQYEKKYAEQTKEREKSKAVEREHTQEHVQAPKPQHSHHWQDEHPKKAHTAIAAHDDKSNIR